MAIQYQVVHEVIDGGGLFEVSVIADAGTNVCYSLALGGAFARPLGTEVRREMARWIAQRDDVVRCTRQLAFEEQKLVLLKRKKALENGLLQEAEEECQQIEAKLEALDLELDGQDEMEDGGASVVRQINDLKLENKEACQLRSLRSKFNDKLSSELRSATRGCDALKDRQDALTEENNELEALLSTAAARLWNPPAANLVMAQLKSDGEDRPPALPAATGNRPKTFASTGVRVGGSLSIGRRSLCFPTNRRASNARTGRRRSTGRTRAEK